MLAVPGRSSLPVINEDTLLLGILSRGDLLRITVTQDEVIQSRAQALLDSYAGTHRWQAQVSNAVVTVHGDFPDETERRLACALARTVPGARSSVIADDQAGQLTQG